MKTLKLFLTVVFVVFACYYSQGQTSTLKDDLSKAQSLAQQGNTAEASKVYLEIMGKHPENRDAVQGWLIINMKRSPTGEEEAIKQLEELEKTYPDNTGILFFKTFIQTEYNHLDDALKNAEKLTILQPDDYLNWVLKGQVLEAMNRNDEALAALEKSTSLGSENADAWQIKAGLLAKLNKLDEAITSYNKAIELAPGQPVFLYNRGCVYCRKGDKANALADLGKAISMNPQFKTYAPKDEDYKSLWEDEEFKKLVSQ
jgi:tetratricopeptide (TPR) repeat protein